MWSYSHLFVLYLHPVFVHFPMQDTYVLHDYNFRLLTHISNGDQYKDKAPVVSALVGGWVLFDKWMIMFL